MTKMLIVEDEKMLSEMYKDKFEHEGFEVLTSCDGEDGLKTALREQPDVLILDVLLPKKEGVDVLKEIRESGEWGESASIIMLTNLDSSDYILEMVNKYRPSYYFIKANIELDELVAKVKELTEE